MPFKDRQQAIEYCKNYLKKARLKNPNKYRVRAKLDRIRIKYEIMKHYCRGIPKCQCCGEEIFEFLSIDHINGGGSNHRKKLKGSTIYYWLKKNNYPKGYQVLCINCNFAKGHFGSCPHTHR